MKVRDSIAIKNSRGFSLIELIIVIAITAVIIGVLWMGFSSVGSRQVKQCVNNIESFMGRTKGIALAKDSAEMVIRKETDGFYVDLMVGTGSVPAETKKIAADSLKVSYFTGPSAETEITGAAVLQISFMRDSGAFTPLTGTTYCEKIKVSKGTFTMEIVLVAETGKYYIN